MAFLAQTLGLLLFQDVNLFFSPSGYIRLIKAKTQDTF